MAKNYYLVLGISPGATPEQIRSAYRKKAKNLHPDRVGGGCEPFQAVQEAYEVLGDPARRRSHDDQLAREQHIRSAPGGITGEPLQRRRCPVEPLVPRGRSARPEVSFSGLPLQSLIEDVFRDPWRGPFHEARSATGRSGGIHLSVHLTPDEALTGGHIRALIPVRTSCPTCYGQGSRLLFTCPRCQGRGTLAGNYAVEIAYPPGVADRSTLTVPLTQLDAGEAYLVLHFRVGEP
jgi:DnaJ-class molecular chaperone